MDLEAPSMRYQLLPTLDEIAAGAHNWNDAETASFLLDDISARERPESIIGGCLLDLNEEQMFFHVVNAYEHARSVGQRTDALKSATEKLLARMHQAGVPSFS